MPSKNRQRNGMAGRVGEMYRLACLLAAAYVTALQYVVSLIPLCSRGNQDQKPWEYHGIHYRPD